MSKRRSARKRRCLSCKNSFISNPKVKNQRYCSKKECQKVRQIKNHKEWLRRGKNKEDARADVKQWHEQHPDYLSIWKKRHPAYVKHNREQTRKRMGELRALRLACLEKRGDILKHAEITHETLTFLCLEKRVDGQPQAFWLIPRTQQHEIP